MARQPNLWEINEILRMDNSEDRGKRAWLFRGRFNENLRGVLAGRLARDESREDVKALAPAGPSGYALGAGWIEHELLGMVGARERGGPLQASAWAVWSEMLWDDLRGRGGGRIQGFEAGRGSFVWVDHAGADSRHQEQPGVHIAAPRLRSAK